jgi:hypothetical protein
MRDPKLGDPRTALDVGPERAGPRFAGDGRRRSRSIDQPQVPGRAGGRLAPNHRALALRRPGRASDAGFAPTRFASPRGA